MPKQTRWQLKRDLEQAVGNLDTASEYLIRVGSRFKGVHDDYYQALEQIYVNLQIIVKAINDVKDMI